MPSVVCGCTVPSVPRRTPYPGCHGQETVARTEAGDRARTEIDERQEPKRFGSAPWGIDLHGTWDILYFDICQSGDYPAAFFDSLASGSAA